MDIIFFAALAFYLFFRLNKQLGRVDEEEKKQVEVKAIKKRAEILAIKPVIAKQHQDMSPGLPDSEAKNQAEEQILSSLEEPIRQNLVAVLQSCKISADFFINGAKSAFEMILKAFASADYNTLKFLLSDKIYQGFEAAVNHRKSQEHTLITNLISIEKAEIISAMMLGNFASIAVRISSQQINYITDKDGQIIEGKKDEINNLTDIWTFKKDITSKNPNWVVSATSSN
jgi:predicted lipid-binding transport protein (Tim44 family)